jgi:molybdopterin biosynthesis enzyme MoaB
MSPDPGGFRLLLVDLVGGGAGRWPLGVVEESLGAASGELITPLDRREFDLVLAGEKGRQDGALILTFGRISCGREDWAPDATDAAAVSRVPALATALRLLWTERHPEAFLFRNSVAVLGSSLVINLPAESAMVEESVPLIARVARHALEKIAGDDAACGR